MLPVPAPRLDGGLNAPTVHHPIDGDDDGGAKPITSHPQSDGGPISNAEDEPANPIRKLRRSELRPAWRLRHGHGRQARLRLDHGYIDDGHSSDMGICIEDKSYDERARLAVSL